MQHTVSVATWQSEPRQRPMARSKAETISSNLVITFAHPLVMRMRYNASKSGNLFLILQKNINLGVSSITKSV